MTKKKTYLAIAVLIIIALAILFSGRVVSEKKENITSDALPIDNSLDAPTGIPANMSISEELGG
jgi:hypothetical protein